MTRKNATLIGTAVGLALFLAIALLPALLYGGYAGVLLAGGIFAWTMRPCWTASRPLRPFWISPCTLRMSTSRAFARARSSALFT